MASYTYPKKRPAQISGYILLLLGALMLASPLESRVKLLIAILTYLIGGFILLQGRRLKSTPAEDWTIVLNEMGISGQQDGEPWAFNWGELAGLAVRFPSTNPCLELFLTENRKLTLSLSRLPKRFEFIGEMKNYCGRIEGAPALDSVSTAGKWFRFIFLSTLLGIGIILALFAVIPLLVYFFFLR